MKLNNFKAGAGCITQNSKKYNALGLSYNLADIEYAKKIAYASFIYNKRADQAFVDQIGSFAFDTVSKLGQKFLPGLADKFFSSSSDTVTDLGGVTDSLGIDSDILAGDDLGDIPFQAGDLTTGFDLN